jgi:amidase
MHGSPPHRRLVGPASRKLLSETARSLKKVVDVEPPSIMDPAPGWLTVLLTEIKATLGPDVDQSGNDDLRRIFGWNYEMGTILDLDAYRAGLGNKTRMERTWNVFLESYPLVLTRFLMRSGYPWSYDA